MGRSSTETKPAALPSGTCKKMQVHEIGFQEAMTESSTRRRLPARERLRVCNVGIPDSLVGQPHRAVEAKLTLAPGAQSNASALTICRPGFKMPRTSGSGHQTEME